jgi:sugar phosphate isomerase/epimerase
MDMKWGKMVADLSEVQRAASDGFDFVQPVRELAAGLGDEQAAGRKARGLDSGLPCEVCALPLPAEVRVTQKGFNLYVWIEYLKNALDPLAGLGCRKLIWSDGRARVLPVEGEIGALKEQALQFLYLLCEAAANVGMSVLVEPLGPRRTNFLNSMKEVSDFLPRVGKENLSALISLRELEPIGLSVPDLATYRQLIDHVHMDNPLACGAARICPRPNDGYEYRPFVQALKEMGYSALISLPGDADAGALAYCRALWKG